jgi:hypothetical protein
MSRFFLVSLLSMMMMSSTCQVKDRGHEVHELFLAEQNTNFKDSEHSPLTEADLAEFQFINYYPYEPSYRVEARWVVTPDEEPFPMPTSTKRAPLYRKYGELHFELDGRELVLAAYRSMDLKEVEGFEEHLFIPFNDLTNGETSYGGGRYIDFSIPTTEAVTLDFNNSYHPYCAYNHKYSCPIPPDENMLDVEIEAGVKVGLNGSIETTDEH